VSLLNDDNLQTLGIDTMPTLGLYMGLLRIYLIYAVTEVTCNAPHIKRLCDVGEKHQCCKGEFITPIRHSPQTILALTQIPRRQPDRLPD